MALQVQVDQADGSAVHHKVSGSLTNPGTATSDETRQVTTDCGLTEIVSPHRVNEADTKPADACPKCFGK